MMSNGIITGKKGDSMKFKELLQQKSARPYVMGARFGLEKKVSARHLMVN